MIQYSFAMDEDRVVEFEVDVDSDTSHEVPDRVLPDWVLLERHRCPDCPLEEGSRRSCPAALAVLPVVEAFGQCISYQTIDVSVRIAPIHLGGEVPAHSAVRSLMGLLMSLSTCPVMEKLRPMAQFHLPFGSSDHTLFRFLGMYLIAQHLRRLDGQEPDWELKGLLDLFDKIHMVNRKMSKRMLEAVGQDAAVNGLIILDSQAYAAQMDVERSLATLGPLFAMYLK